MSSSQTTRIQATSQPQTSLTLQSITNLYGTGQVSGTRNLGNGRRGAISGPSEAYDHAANGFNGTASPPNHGCDGVDDKH